METSKGALTLKRPYQKGDGAWVWDVDGPACGPCPPMAYPLSLGHKSECGARITQQNHAASLRYQGYAVQIEDEAASF